MEFAGVKEMTASVSLLLYARHVLPYQLQGSRPASEPEYHIPLEWLECSVLSSFCWQSMAKIDSDYAAGLDSFYVQDEAGLGNKANGDR